MGKQWKQCQTIFLGSKITADGDYSHEIKRCLLLGRKVMTNLDSLLKSRDITLPTKVRLVKAMVFPVVMYGCESWTVKKAKCWRIDAFELWCWRRLLRVPLDCKEIQPVHFEGDQSYVFIGKTEGERRRGQQRVRWLDTSPTQWTWVWASSGSWWWTGKPGVLQSMESQRVRHDWATELNRTDLPA